jgi:hypothetical protein
MGASLGAARRVLKTRTPHVCEECRKQIAVGTTAYKSAWIFEGQFAHGYAHIECTECVGAILRHVDHGDALVDEGYDGRMFLYQLLSYAHEYRYVLNYIHDDHPLVSEHMGLDPIIAQIALEGYT